MKPKRSPRPAKHDSRSAAYPCHNHIARGHSERAYELLTAAVHLGDTCHVGQSFSDASAGSFGHPRAGNLLPLDSSQDTRKVQRAIPHNLARVSLAHVDSVG